MLDRNVDQGVRLIRPNRMYKDAYLSFYNEWKASGEKMVPWVIERDPSNFEDMLLRLEDDEDPEKLPEGWVTNSTYWLVDDTNVVKIVGVVNIRHALTPVLRKNGGHIGYGIRPGERRKGYATILLAKALEIAKNRGISDILLVCHAHNVASERTIRRHGGMEDEGYVDEAGESFKRFWIHPGH
ncbi:GNAT family N-acetyltransferase [Marinicrinis sediminis]|uniref:GNAT family N-acetyltransferase n=1 Tax=Marinicrinis sediminis TaxID=1652465 RepID=A0ABW5R9Q9_9BACL